MYRNVSDYSGFCHRQRVLLCEAQLEQEPIKIWQRELTENASMMELFQGHESMWSFRRFLVFEWLKCASASQSLNIDAEADLFFKTSQIAKDETYALTYFCWLVEVGSKYGLTWNSLEPDLLHRFTVRFDEIASKNPTPLATKLRKKLEVIR